MQTKQGGRSTEASDQPERDSVFDFLYHDPRRIGSFLAQFEPHGHLQSLTHSHSVADTKAEKGGMDVAGGLPKLAEVKGGFEMQEAESTTTGLSRTYDPIWANARAFFDYLAENALLHKDVRTAAVGQFVLCSGSLMVLDTAFTQRLYQHESIRKKAVLSKEVNPETGRPYTREELSVEWDALSEIVPHVQAHLTCHDSYLVWGSLRAEGLVTPPNELAMKHGNEIDGVWSMIGIKDGDPIPVDRAQRKLEYTLKYYRDYRFATQALTLNARLRFLMGRPHYAYGITPLAIFRQIGG